MSLGHRVCPARREPWVMTGREDRVEMPDRKGTRDIRDDPEWSDNRELKERVEREERTEISGTLVK